MFVPLIMNKRIKQEHIRTVDLFPTILDYLKKEIANDIDGKKLNVY